MENHPELSPVNNPELQDIHDALELAFFDMPLADCTFDDVPLDPMMFDQNYFFDFKMREKNGFDTEANCTIYVTHFSFDQLHDDGITHENILAIEWEREEDNILIVDLTDQELGLITNIDNESYDYVAAQSEARAQLKELTKRTLAIITKL